MSKKRHRPEEIVAELRQVELLTGKTKSGCGSRPTNIYRGSPWENGYNERFNGTLRLEVYNAE